MTLYSTVHAANIEAFCENIANHEQHLIDCQTTLERFDDAIVASAANFTATTKVNSIQLEITTPAEIALIQ